ncbi:MAG TPA: M56 family metallopeptidase [Vicinamibacterales bacterium]|nr:M56 family metallopeptidase [Vicinamibacterales bacterium]
MIGLVFMARSSIVLLAGLAAIIVLRKQPAALRHWIIAAALLLAVAQPAITLIVPALPVPVVNWNVADSTGAATATVETDYTVAVDLPKSTAAPAIDWTAIIIRAWIAGVAISVCSLLAGIGWLMWLGSRARDAGSEWLDVEILVRSQIKLTRPVRVAITSHPALIVTWGAFAPVILLPADADTWSVDRKRLVIAHEMAHLVRQDWLIQLFAEIARSINWFNPLFWIACERLRRESEHASDDIVLETGIAGTSYAAHLIDLARSVSAHRTWLPAPSIARPSTLERRVRAMLNPAVNRQPVSRRLQLAIVALLCAIALPIAAASQASSTPSGKVSDPSGRPLADATLRLTPANGGDAAETRTDANGAFQFSQLPAGEYLLSVRYPGFSTSRQRLQLNPGGTTIELQVQVGTLQERITVDSAASGTQVETAARPAPQSCTASPTGGQIIPPMKIRDVRPAYKKEWIDAGLQGVILMKATIGRDGKVRGVDVISPVNAELEDAAMLAVSRWEFTSTYLNCEPVEVQMYVTVEFRAAQ